MRLKVTSEDVGDGPDKANFVLESFGLAHGHTLRRTTDKDIKFWLNNRKLWSYFGIPHDVSQI